MVFYNIESSFNTQGKCTLQECTAEKKKKEKRKRYLGLNKYN